MVEWGLFQLACQNLHFSSIATLITSVALFDDSVSFSFFCLSFGCERMDNLLFVGLVNFGWLQQQVYTRWTDCWTCSRRQLSTKIKCQAIPEEAVTIDNSTGFWTLNFYHQPQNLFSFLQVPNPLGFVEFFWSFLQCALLRMTSGTYTQIMGCLIFFTVLVVGGGGVGMEVVRSFAKAGSWVTAYQRGEKFRKEIEELGAMLAIGDVLDVGAIEKTLRGNSFDAIVCTVGRLPVRLPSQYLQINWLEEFPYLALLDFLLSSQQFLFHLHSGFLCNFL